jgi:hypothetical protein
VIGLGALTEPFAEIATVTTLPELGDQLRSALEVGAPA